MIFILTPVQIALIVPVVQIARILTQFSLSTDTQMPAFWRKSVNGNRQSFLSTLIATEIIFDSFSGLHKPWHTFSHSFIIISTTTSSPSGPPSCSSSCPWHYKGGMRSHFKTCFHSQLARCKPLVHFLNFNVLVLGPSSPEIPEISKLSWNCPELWNCPEIFVNEYKCPDIEWPLFCPNMWLFNVLVATLIYLFKWFICLLNNVDPVFMLCFKRLPVWCSRLICAK